ncbi:PEGA domain-containing protein [Chondromyces crocatus]|uniref:PEGA domain-containing protein n=1 Tax=Chondromyces crocatus TaxID=52 RepID=A0A0K1EQC4_CHOCO|nr:PEGA domain-containing protein [Chondromyces crocatus]AKT42823.1 uncharacterized protein CMC5_070510 [Chondromyces crocatus]
MRSTGLRLTSLLLSASLLLGAVPVVHAQSGTKSQAPQLKQAGDEHMRNKQYEDALASYDAAYAASSDPVLHYNRGRALQFLARYPDALDALRRFQSEAPAATRARVPGLQDLIAEVRAKVAIVRVDCAVSGARVLIAKREIGTTPLAAPISLNAGTATVEILADGYHPFEQELELRGDEALNVVEAKLTRKTTVGTLVVRSHVPGARVTVDGRGVGAVPVEASLQAGRHALVVSADGHDETKTQVVIVAGERREFMVDPVKRPPIYAKWWFWTAVGVVAAGAVVTYVAVTTESAPPSGSFSPGVVRF